MGTVSPRHSMQQFIQPLESLPSCSLFPEDYMDISIYLRLVITVFITKELLDFCIDFLAWVAKPGCKLSAGVHISQTKSGASVHYISTVLAP